MLGLQALEEAEKYKAGMNGGGMHENDLADARDLYNKKRAIAVEAER